MKSEVEIELLKAAIYEVGLLFNQQPNEARINAYARALQNYSPKQVTYAFNQVVLSGSAFFPSLAEVLTHLRPTQEKTEDKAPLIATEIINFIRLHHVDLEKEYSSGLTPEAIMVIAQMGGTRDIRNSENFETMRAQLERVAKGVINRIGAVKKTEALQRITSGGNILSLQTLDYSNFLPSNEGHT